LYLGTFQYSYTIAEIIGPGFFATLFAVCAGLPWVALAAVNLLAVFVLVLLERRLPKSALSI
jgi:hypothetical protein